MRDFDYFSLDGTLLRTFLTILEESSVSRAADRLGVTQSAVSHSLARLRRVLGDPLFVRSGQGLTPTERALSLRDPVQQVLDGMKALTQGRPFDPLSEPLQFRVAANDMQRELIFPPLLRETRAEGIRLTLDFVPSGVPDAGILRHDGCDLLLTPVPPDAPDLFQKRLLSSPLMVYFDASQREPPRDWEEYCACEHVEVRFAGGRSAQVVLRDVDQARIRRPTVTLPSFNAIPAFVMGSDLISTDSALMKRGPLRDLDCAALPFDCPSVSIFMVWHERSNNDPAHRWLRRRIEMASARYSDA